MLEDSEAKQKALNATRDAIPGPMFRLMQPFYHLFMAIAAAFLYGNPSASMKVIGVTGTKGKSTTCLMIAKIFEDQGKAVAMIGSLGYKIKDKEWPNTLKMTMPGRFKLQKFLSEAKRAGCEYVAIEVTSEGIVQKRLQGVTIDCAVFTNLHKEHIEAHDGFENYMEAKKMLFKKTPNIHIINADNKYAQEFMAIPAKQRFTFGLQQGDINQQTLGLNPKLAGEFNVYNGLAAISVAHAYGLDIATAQATVESLASVPGRMEYVEVGQPFEVVIDYAHTPESLEGVYQTLKLGAGKLIGVLGAAGGGRDHWKRPVFGEIAARYCDEIILTNEDPYDEDPEQILRDIEQGIQPTELNKVKAIIDRAGAIATAVEDAQAGDTIVITGKGSETSIAMAGGKRIPWSDKEVVKEILKNKGFTAPA